MISIIQFLCLFLLLFIAYFKAKKIFYFSLYMYITIGSLVLRWLNNGFYSISHNLFLLLFCILFLVRLKDFRSLYKYGLLFLCALYIGYFLLYSIIYNISPWNNMLFYKNFVLFSIYGVLLIEDIQNGNITRIYVLNLVVFMMFVESILGIIQYFNPSISYAFMTSEDLLKVVKYTTQRYVVGSLTFPAGYASFLFSSLSFVLLLYAYKRINIDKYLLLGITIATIALFMTGIRAPFFIYLLLLSFVGFKRRNKYIIFLIFAFFLLVFTVLQPMIMNSGDVAQNLENPIERMLAGFSLFSNTNISSSTTDSTFDLFVGMLPYWFSNPFWGVALHEVGNGYMLNNVGTYLEMNNTTDSQFMFTLCEIGLIGFLLALFPILIVVTLYIKGYNKKIVLMYFLFQIMITLIDTGMFAYSSIFLLYTFIASLSGENNKKIAL